jgi:hypothetical protein
MKKKTYTEKEIAAAQRFAGLKNRTIHPKGSFDKAGRFYLDTTYSCCSVRRPSRSYPYSQMVHGRTAEHVSHETGIDASLIRKIAKEIENFGKPDPLRAVVLYKTVAAVDGKFLSIFDGKTEYKIGEITKSDVTKMSEDGHDICGCGGIFCYESLEDARRASFPGSSKLYSDPIKVVILRGVGYGKRNAVDKKTAIKKFIPVSVVGAKDDDCFN